MSSIRLAFIWCVTILPADFSSGQSEDAPDVTTQGTPEKKQVIVVGQVYNHIGAGVEHATVTVTLKSSGAEIGTATTNHYGDFSIESSKAPTGTIIVTFSKQHFKDATREVKLGTPNEPPFVDVEMMGAIVLAGTITDDLKKTPIASAKVKVKAGYKEWDATSAADGSFTIEGLLPGEAVLTVETGGYARINKQIEQIEWAGRLELRLEPERIVYLHVTDEKGNPINGVNIECLDEAFNDYRHLVTDAEGKATIRGLRYRTTELAFRLTHEAYVSSPDFDRTVKPPTDKAESTHRLIMHPASTIIGTIAKAKTQKPMFGARIAVGKVSDDRSPRAWSEFDGTYRVTGVTPGEAIVTVHLAEHAPELKKVAVEAGKETTLDFTLTQTRSMIGVVVGSDGKPIPDVYVTATQWRGYATLGLRAITNEQGQFEILDVPLDAFEVSLYASGYEPLIDRTVTPGQPKYDFTLATDTRSARMDRGSGPKVGDDAPGFTMTTLDGETIELAKLKGKVVLLDFWATWCGPCLSEIPNLMEVYKVFGNHPDFVMIGVSLDRNEAKLRSFVSAKKMAWKHAVGATGHADKTADTYHVVAIPATFIIGADGKIAAVDLHGQKIHNELTRILDPQKGVRRNLER